LSAADLGLPAGVRDYLPDGAARLKEVSRALEDAFARFGYRRVVVPTIERMSVVARGLGEEAGERLFNAVEPGTGEVVAICPDHTTRVGRLWAAALHALPAPVRVSYVGAVLRAREERAGRPREVFQAGAEYLGAGGVAADAEIVVLCDRALRAVGLDAAVLDLGHAGYVQAFFDAAELSADGRQAARDALSSKDAAGLGAIAEAEGGRRGGRGSTRAKARRALPELAGLYGGGSPARARRLARKAGLGKAALAAVDEVEAVIEAATACGLDARLTVDLGETRGFGYYTGLTLHAFAEGAGGEVASGGRYDDLLARYGRPAPAVGLAVDIAFLLDALDGRATVEADGWVLVGGDRPAAEVLFAGERLRAGGHRVAILPGRHSEARALAHAAAHRFDGVLMPARGAGKWRQVDVAGGPPRSLTLEALGAAS
jgi:ATP phosphoribosyltransferase regulatory subunit